MATVAILIEPWRAHPLAWIHRAEARSIAAELAAAGRPGPVVRFDPCRLERLPAGPLLLRVSDPLMLRAAEALTRAGIPYLGPGAAAMARCYDKHEAWRIASGAGIDCPATALGRDWVGRPAPFIVKPRRGSDSIGVRLIRRGGLPNRHRNDRMLVQEYVCGTELTIAVLRGRVGAPLRIELPEGTIYSFGRKYVWRPGRAPLRVGALAARIRDTADRIAGALGVDWAARIDLLHETATDRLRFLECDVAPLVGAASAFAASLAAAGVDRGTQLRLLV